VPSLAEGEHHVVGELWEQQDVRDVGVERLVEQA